MNELIGQPLDRVDGRAKVTGAASYSAEFNLKDLAHAVTVQSAISRGSIKQIDTMLAEAAPGVLSVMTYKNAPRLKFPTEGASAKNSIMLGEKELLPLQNEQIFYDGQHIAMVVAETFEQAEYAAGLIKTIYQEEPPALSLETEIAHQYEPKESMKRPLQTERGDPDAAWQQAEVKINETYSTPVFHHNPMEPHATIAEWTEDRLTLYDSTQSVMGNRNAVAAVLGIPQEKIHLVSLYVGGGFGCKGFTWPHTILAPLAAREIGRPVKLVLSRQQMFTCNGRRGRTVQTISLGAGRSGALTVLKHKTLTETSFVGEFVETSGLASQMLYACPNVQITHRLVRLNRGTPTAMRAPGEATGTFALECALDELAHELKMDPVELRSKNYAETDPQKNLPWSSKNLRECYQRGAEAIGWSNRHAQPGTARQGKYLVGYGMATATYPANRVPASAKVQILADGRAIASSATQDIGTGTYTIMTQLAAEALGLPMDRVQFRLGDSNLPKAPVSGGSQTAASVGPAVKEAALAARKKILELAVADEKSPLHGETVENLTVENGRCFMPGNPGGGETYAEILNRQGRTLVEAEATTKGSTRPGGEKPKPAAPDKKSNPDEQLDAAGHSFHSFGAQFVKILFDPALGTVRLEQCAGVFDIGKVLNLKTAKNQIMGGMIFGIGMALMEETIYDPNCGRVVTRDLANYLVPVHADVPLLEVQFLDLADPFITSVGARGIGEIGITGITAAIANAIFNATGKRIRDLPITPDKLI